jgi:hypothetical protein
MSKPMTVCIAAICNSGKSIVVAADRMFTNPGLSVEFETTERKIEQIGNRCIVMAAGNSVNATEVIERVRARLGGNPNPALIETAEVFRREYAMVRNKMAMENVVMPTRDRWTPADTRSALHLAPSEPPSNAKTPDFSGVLEFCLSFKSPVSAIPPRGPREVRLALPS